MLSAERIALLKHGAPPRNALEAALRNVWYGGGGASYEKTVGPAPIISISDAKAKAAKSLIVGMEPIQDLHGYDNPWPAGGGKNLLNIDSSIVTSTQDGITMTVNRNAEGSVTSIVLNGTATKRTYISLGRYNLYAGTILNGCPSGGTIDSYTLAVDGTAIADRGNGSAIDQDVDAGWLMIVIGSGYTANGLVFKPMIRLASVTDDTFAPYSNLCPISGRTGVTVERTGANLANDAEFSIEKPAWAPNNNIWVGLSKNPDGTYTLTRPLGWGGYGFVYIGTYKTGTYTVSYDVIDTANVQCVGQISVKNKGTWVDNTTINTATITAVGRKSFSNITITQECDFWLAVGPFTENGAQVISGDYQVELHSSATPYEPYVGATYPVSWQSEAGTVYGGTLDVVSGLLTVEYVKKIVSSFDGIFGAVTNGYCVFILLSDTTHDTDEINVASMKSNLFQYSGVYHDSMPLWSYGGTSGASPTQTFILPSTITSLNEANAWLSALDVPLECTFKLAEPQTYQLTPQQIQLLKGSNTLWSDGDSLTLTYIGITPANLLGGMLGVGFGGAQEPIEETSEEPTEGEDE